jgi:hypothetical protein
VYGSDLDGWFKQHLNTQTTEFEDINVGSIKSQLILVMWEG